MRYARACASTKNSLFDDCLILMEFDTQNVSSCVKGLQQLVLFELKLSLQVQLKKSSHVN